MRYEHDRLILVDGNLGAKGLKAEGHPEYESSGDLRGAASDTGDMPRYRHADGRYFGAAQ